MANDVEKELSEAIRRILTSQSKKKLVVAGPGVGKTTLFRKLLDQSSGDAEQQLVLTFIHNLKTDLERSLGNAAKVFTLHGYCQHLLHRNEELRNGLSSDFRCYPGLASLIKKDWEWLKSSNVPSFVDLMRKLSCPHEASAFYFQRANYYDAVDFDDSVYRTYQALLADKSLIPNFELVLIDEFQDFNKMEASVIDLLAEQNPILIAGDDDQALYSQLRGASWDHIRARYESGQYEVFELPFCMRCPEVIVSAVNDVISKACADKKLQNRIEKPYRYYEPVKGEDSRRYPKIELVETTVQRVNANYFGRYIIQCIEAIPEEEIRLAAEKCEPIALIIGSNPYRRQVEKCLSEADLVTGSDEEGLNEQEQAFKILNQNATSNLGWRIMLASDKESFASDLVKVAATKGISLAEIIPADYRACVLNKAEAWAKEQEAEKVSGANTEAAPKVLVTSFEGAKGLSSQYVFLIGLHSGEIPRDAKNVQDIEICRFLVGMTRTKKKCSVLVTRRFGDEFKSCSEFLYWINAKRFKKIEVNADYWKKRSACEVKVTAN